MDFLFHLETRVPCAVCRYLLSSGRMLFDKDKKIRRLPFRPDNLRAKPGGEGLEDESVVAFSVNLIANFHPDTSDTKILDHFLQ